jgi:dihydrofolate reductase
MIVSIIVAMDRRRGIGLNNQLPWRLSADLKRFRDLTMGRHLIVGRRTYESIGQPLPGRQMIVVTRNKNYRAAGCAIAHSLDEALALARAEGESEAFIGGGAELFAEALPIADRLYLTRVDAETAADTFFPEWDEQAWTVQESSAQAADEKNQYSSTFQLLKRQPA